MPDKDNQMNIFKCHCNYHLGMGPNLQCPIHGTRENLHAGVLSRRRELARLNETHDAMLTANRVIREGLEDDVQKWKKIAQESLAITCGGGS